VAVSVRNKHRVALELDIDEDPAHLEPEAWDLHDLQVALAAGLARPLRMIHGLVLDTERDHLSVTLQAIAEGIGEVVQGYWMISATPTCPQAVANRTPRPSIELLVELQAIAEQAERAAGQLREQGL
jgi:hypothetical protein